MTGLAPRLPGRESPGRLRVRRREGQHGFGTVRGNPEGGDLLPGPSEITRAIAAKYERRLGMMVDLLREKGSAPGCPAARSFSTSGPPGIRGGERFQSAEQASQWLIRRKQISTVPWDDVGAYLRFSCTFAASGESEERRVIDEVRRRLSNVEFEW